MSTVALFFHQRKPEVLAPVLAGWDEGTLGDGPFYMFVECPENLIIHALRVMGDWIHKHRAHCVIAKFHYTGRGVLIKLTRVGASVEAA